MENFAARQYVTDMVDADPHQQLAGILAVATDAIIELDAHFRITLFNSGAERIFGFTTAEMLGEPLDALLPERTRQIHRHHVEAFAVAPVTSRQMAERGRILGLRRSGEEFPAEASISKITFGGKTNFIVILRDITATLAQEKALQDSAQRLQLAVTAGNIGFFEYDFGSDSLFLSPIARQVIGFKADEPVTWRDCLALVPPEYGDALVQARTEALNPTADGSTQLELRIAKRDDGLRWLALDAKTEFSAGVPVRSVGTVRDITDRRTAAALLEQANQDLERRVVERTQALQQELVRREQIQAALVKAQRLEAIGQLTGGVAHDFNNLLTVISGNLELLASRVDDAETRTLVARAQDATDMAARLTARLLSFARRRRLDPVLLQLNEIVNGMSELLERTLGETIKLKLVLAPDLALVHADASEIENALLNLVINARDAMPEGGRVVIQTANTEIDPTTARTETGQLPGKFVRMSVTDTGHGMTPEILQRAFEPFFTTKEAGRGTGLGLSTIYGFTRQSGGFAQIYSEAGEGTTVNLYLPRAETTGALLEPPRRDEVVYASAGETVLVVEDNDQVREATLQRIEGLGYAVLEARNGTEAMSVIAKSPGIALVFSDVVMSGGMSGLDLARWIATEYPQLRVVLTSGFAADALSERKVEDKRWPLLQKPYSRSQLSLALATALNPASRSG